MALKIESDIPVPSGGGRHQSEAGVALRALEVGQSVLLTPEVSRDVTGLVTYIKKTTGHKFCTRAVDGGRRVWRIA